MSSRADFLLHSSSVLVREFPVSFLDFVVKKWFIVIKSITLIW